MPEVEKITPYGGDAPKEQQVEQMFDSIAPAYDFMNRAMTLGIDRLWRRKAVGMLRASEPKKVLDVATGTGDLAILLARKLPQAEVIGVDLSSGMIKVGQEKIARKQLSDRVSLQVGDCLALPFDNAAFDCITVAYGVRNFADLEAGYREMRRVLRQGGKLCVIELSTPTNPIIKPLYNFYTKHVIPFVGRMVSKDTRAYSYLPESIAAVPQRESMCELMRRAGFSEARYRSLTFGVCTIYIAE